MNLIRPLDGSSSVISRLVLESENDVRHVDVLDSLDGSSFGLMIVVEVLGSDVLELVNQPLGRDVDLTEFLT